MPVATSGSSYVIVKDEISMGDCCIRFSSPLNLISDKFDFGCLTQEFAARSTRYRGRIMATITIPLPAVLEPQFYGPGRRRNDVELSLGLTNGRESGSRGGLSFQRAQTLKRDRPSFPWVAVPVLRCSVGSNRDSIRRFLSRWSGNLTENDQRCVAIQGFGRLARVWSRHAPRERSKVSGRRGNREWVPERSRETRNGIALHCGGAMAGSRTVEGHGFDLSRTPASPKSGKAGDTGAAWSQSTFTKSTSVGVLLGGLVLAVGFFGLRFCKPAFAENIAVPPTVSSPLNADRDVETRESKSSETEAQRVDDGVVPVKRLENQSEANESGAEEFEPPFGEGSDLTNDPAEVLLRSYLEMHPSDKKALQALLFQRLKKGEVNAALPVLKKLVELEPENLEWKYIKAHADEYAGDLVQARRGFEEILQMKPLSARAWQGLAVIMHNTGEDEEALEMLIEAVKTAVDEGHSKEALNLRMLLGQLHTMQGNFEKAMELYKTVVEEDPQDYRPYLCQGLVYSIIGEEAEAEKYFRRYRKLCPKDFPQRGFLDELMLRAKSESGMLNKRMKKEEELKKTGRKVPKIMRQPLASGDGPNKENQNQNSR